MTDYSKPIGHWCDARGTIPMYAIIPEGERPSTHDETHPCVDGVTKLWDLGPDAVFVNVPSALKLRVAIHSLSDDLGSVAFRKYRARRINQVARATARGRRGTLRNRANARRRGPRRDHLTPRHRH